MNTGFRYLFETGISFPLEIHLEAAFPDHTVLLASTRRGTSGSFSTVAAPANVLPVARQGSLFTSS